MGTEKLYNITYFRDTKICHYRISILGHYIRKIDKYKHLYFLKI